MTRKKLIQPDVMGAPQTAMNPVDQKDDYFARLYKKMNKNKPKTYVSVLVRKSSEMLGQALHIRVQVFSTMKAGRAQQAEKEMYRQDSMDAYRGAAGLMAAALAEKCCTEYGDDYDPSEFHRMGLAAFDQVVKKLQDGELTPGIITG